MMSEIIEKDWVTSAGLRAVCVLVQLGSHRCGYVAVPMGHPLFGKRYQQIEDDISVHGGLTFSSDSELTHNYPAYSKEPVTWFGFDCAHIGDQFGFLSREGVRRSTEFVVNQCESLASQLKENL